MKALGIPRFKEAGIEGRDGTSHGVTDDGMFLPAELLDNLVCVLDIAPQSIVFTCAMVRRAVSSQVQGKNFYRLWSQLLKQNSVEEREGRRW